MANVNVVAISGNLGDEAVFRVGANGTQLITFDVAVNERVRDGKGEWTNRANWFRCVTFGKQAEWLDKELHRGTYVSVSGRLRQEQYEVDGQTRRAVSIIAERVDVLSPRTQGQAAGTQDASGAAPGAYDATDIPF